MEVVVPTTLATGTGNRPHLPSERMVVPWRESSGSSPTQARASKLVQANEHELAAVRRKSDLRPPPRWGLNE